MNQIINRQIQLASRPQGKPKTEDLKPVSYTHLTLPTMDSV